MRGRLLKALKSKRREKMPLAPQLCLQANKIEFQVALNKQDNKKDMLLLYIARILIYLRLFFSTEIDVWQKTRSLISNDMGRQSRKRTL